MKRAPNFIEPSQQGRGGFALIIVMVIVVLVAFAGFAFVNTMSDEYRAVHTNGDQLAADQALASAELLVLHLLEQPQSLENESTDRTADDSQTADVLRDNPLLFQERPLLPPRDGGGAVDDPLAWRLSVVSPDRMPTEVQGETSGLRFGLENESARLNLMTLMDLDAVDPEQSRRILMGFPGMTEAHADALLDWLDDDSESRQFGAEAEEYLDRPNPIQPRNGLPLALDELLLVRDVTRSMLFGPDANRNFVVEPWETLPPDRVGVNGVQPVDAETLDLGWADLLTLHSAERNVNSGGAPRIYLNQSSAPRLREELSAAFPEPVVDFILLYRSHGPAGGQPLVSTSPGSPSTTAGQLRFPLASVGDLIDATVNVAEGASSRVVRSPVTSASRELLDELLDRTTTDPRAVVPGRININLAARPVLRAIPGLEDEVIERLAGHRDTLEPLQRRTPAWLLNEQLLTLEQFRRVLPSITTGGDVYRAQLIAWRPAGGMYRRAEVIVDATSRPARRLAWSDLSAYGAAVPISRLSLLQNSEEIR